MQQNQATSPYLNRPIRTLEQAKRDIELARTVVKTLGGQMYAMKYRYYLGYDGMQIIRNGSIKLEELRVTLDNRLYRVTGSPTIQDDKHAMVEVYRPETMHGWRDRVRFAHWARIPNAKRRAHVRAAVLNKKG